MFWDNAAPISLSPDEVDHDEASVTPVEVPVDVPEVSTPGAVPPCEEGSNGLRRPADPVANPTCVADDKLLAPDLPCCVSLATALVISLMARDLARSDVRTSPSVIFSVAEVWVLRHQSITAILVLSPGARATP